MRAYTGTHKHKNTTQKHMHTYIHTHKCMAHTQIEDGRVRAKDHDRLHREYSKKLEELENERKKLEDDKSQVDRYKCLLIKQRDIMIALTSRCVCVCVRERERERESVCVITHTHKLVCVCVCVYRLTERDDTIKRLEEELDAYDTRQMELEDEMDKKTSALISLQVSNVAMELH